MDILKLTWQELDALPKDKTVLFLTFAPIEEHSHHMPLGVDIFLGEAWKNKLSLIAKEKRRNPFKVEVFGIIYDKQVDACRALDIHRTHLRQLPSFKELL